MTLILDGTLGASAVQDSAIQTADIAPLAVTGPKLSGNQSGSAPIFGARAWCVFNGVLTGTNAPLAGGNVTSVTKNSIGDYTVNFTTGMQDANYCVAVTCRVTGSSTSSSPTPETGTDATKVRIITYNSTNGGLLDASYVMVAIFR